MSKRIGKYKVGGKEQALSAIDGAVISGNLSGINNLTTTGTNSFSGATDFGVLQHRQKVTQLVDLGGSGGALTALTQADSGTQFLVPPLTGGVHTIALPAPSAALVGWHVRFTAVGTLAQILKVQTDTGATKIITNEPDGNGDVTVTVNSNEFHMLAAAEKGCSFSITMISATAAIAFMVHDLTPGIAANTDEFVDA